MHAQPSTGNLQKTVKPCFLCLDSVSGVRSCSTTIIITADSFRLIYANSMLLFPRSTGRARTRIRSHNGASNEKVGKDGKSSAGNKYRNNHDEDTADRVGSGVGYCPAANACKGKGVYPLARCPGGRTSPDAVACD